MRKGKKVFRYNVSLDPKVVEEAQEFLQVSGAKLSPVINNLIIDWIKRKKEEGEILKKNKI